MTTFELILLYVPLQVDLSQAEHVEKYITGVFILVLIFAVAYLGLEVKRKDKAYADLSEKALTVMGETREVIRQNTDLINQIKGKL